MYQKQKYIKYLLKNKMSISTTNMIGGFNFTFDNEHNAVKIDQDYETIKKEISKLKVEFLIDIMKAIIRDVKAKHEKYEKAKFHSVGGINRDKFLGIDSKDLDIVVTHLINVSDAQYFSEFRDFMEFFKLYGEVSDNNPNKDDKTETTKFITYKFIPHIVDRLGNDVTSHLFKELKFEPIDIVAARIEKSTGLAGYHESFVPVYSYNLDIKDDLLRRDFLINAIARDLENDEFVFPYNYTLDTIKNQFGNQILSSVNLANLVIDPTRMLRGVQLCGRLDFSFEDDTYQIIRKYYHLIQFSKKERVEQELLKMCKKSVNLKKALIYFVHSGLYLYLFGVIQSPHIDISHIIETLDHPPKGEKKDSFTINDCRSIFKTNLFATIFENENLYRFSKEHIFEIILGLLSFVAMIERGINKEIILSTIKNNITNNVDYILFISFVIDLCQILFNSSEGKQERINSFNTFVSLVYNNPKLKNSLMIFLRLVEIYDDSFNKDIIEYTNKTYIILFGKDEDEILNVDGKVLRLGDVCIKLSSHNIFLNKGEIQKAVKKAIFMYEKYNYQQKSNIPKSKMDECKKNRSVDEIIKKCTDEFVSIIDENNITQIIHNIIAKVLMQICQ
jgi:tRNA nucleotidyltransferase/poly(A) polymerase